MLAKAGAAEDGTLAVFRKHGIVTATELAAIQATSPQAANNRLRKLLDRGLVERKRQPGRGATYNYVASREFMAQEPE